MEAITVEVLGRPAPKGSRIAGITKSGHSYTRAASRFEEPWVNAVRDGTRNVMRHHAGVQPPYGVDLTIRIARPQKPTSPWPTRHDLDKLVRAVIDGLVKGGAMQDDRHVTEMRASKEFVAEQDAGVLARVYSARAVDAQQRAA